MSQKERSVMQEIVKVPVADWSLWRNCLQGRMSINHPCRGVEAGVGDAIHADSTVVVGYILQKPFDRIESV